LVFYLFFSNKNAFLQLPDCSGIGLPAYIYLIIR
jgi:hypothetical protein